MESLKIDYKNIFYPPGGILLWILIVVELLTFGIALVALVFASKENPMEYHASRLQLNTLYGTINTVLLLISGFFMVSSLHEFKNKRIDKSSLYLKLTMLGGILFLILKAIEYQGKIAHGFVLGYDTFFNFYWLLTGFHVIHVFVGLIILLFIHRSINKPDALLEDFEAGAAFWHMCDLIWIFLFPVLYLIL